MKIAMKEQMRNTDISEILKESLYYSACGNDIGPILFFEKHIHSFIFCLDITYNLGYDTEFEGVKRKLKDKEFRKRVNIDLNIDLIIKNNDDKFAKYSDKFKANWSIWEHENDFLSLLFIAYDAYSLWKNLYQIRQAHPKIFFFQGMFDAWKGGLGKNEGGKFIVNSEIYCDGICVYRNEI